MRKVICAILCAVLLCLCGCASSRQDNTQAENAEKVKLIALEPLTRDETLAMINGIYANRALPLLGRLYCFDFSADYEPLLASYAITDDGLSDFQILAEHCVPEYLTAAEDRLYFVNDGVLESIALDGTDRSVLNAGPCDFMQIHGGALYYTDNAKRFCRAELDGSGETVLIDDCCYPWLMGDTLLYQSEQRGERLYLRHLPDGEEELLTDAPSYAPVLVGSTLYCSQQDGDGSRIYSLSFDTGSAKIYKTPFINGEAEIYFRDGRFHVRGVADTEGSGQWTAELDPLEQAVDTGRSGYSLCDYAGEALSVDTEYEAGGRIRAFALVFNDGRTVRYLAGETIQSKK